jgi:hypothetical protein
VSLVGVGFCPLVFSALLEHLLGATPCSKDALGEEGSTLTEVSVEDILVKQREEHLRRQEEEKIRNKLMLDRGLQPETLFDDIYA